MRIGPLSTALFNRPIALRQAAQKTLKTAASTVSKNVAKAPSLSSPAPLSSFLSSLGNKIRRAARGVKEAVSTVRQVASSLLYKGPILKPWEVKGQPPQTGPRGVAVAIDREALAKAAPGADVSAVAREALEKNAPAVRQFANDSYPLAVEEMLGHGEWKGEGPGRHFDLDDRFVDDPRASQRYRPATYASATKVDDRTIRLRYERYYPNSTISTGDARRLPRETWHEGDMEHSEFLYDVEKKEVVGATVWKHGYASPVGDPIVYRQDQIEFKDGRPVVTVAFGSHATGITGGMEEAATKLSQTLKSIFGRGALDRYPTREDVARGKAVDLAFGPDRVFVKGVETESTVTIAERDRWVDGFLGEDRMRSTYHWPLLTPPASNVA